MTRKIQPPELTFERIIFCQGKFHNPSEHVGPPLLPYPSHNPLKYGYVWVPRTCPKSHMWPGLFAKIPHAMDPATQSDRLSTSVNKQPMEAWIEKGFGSLKRWIFFLEIDVDMNPQLVGLF